MDSFAKFFAALIAVLLAGVNFANAYTLKSFEGRFSVDFPSPPAAQHIRDVGTCMKDQYQFSVSENDRVWIASYQDCLPHGFLEDNGHGPFLRDGWQRMAAAVKGELRANDPIQHGILDGREYLILVPHGTKRIIKVRMFIDGDRVYKLMYIGPVFSEDAPDVEAFFASFRIMR
jgi:hypothetical protein